MKFLYRLTRADWFYPVLFSAGLFAYLIYNAALFWNAAIPSEDFIGNFRPFAQAVLRGEPAAAANKLFPAYPFLLAGASKLVFWQTEDALFTGARLLNLLFALPFLFCAYRLFVRFLGRSFAFPALMFLGSNLYTLYSAINPELEMFLCLTSSLALCLMADGSFSATVPAAITAALKGDSVFIIPACAAANLSKGKNYSRGIAAGIIAALPLCLWFAAKFVFAQAGGNAYLSEVASNGPNLWKYPVDCLLALAGFPKWLGLAVYNGEQNAAAIVAAAASIAAVMLAIVVCLAAGIRGIAKLSDKARLPMFIFAGGFFLIHVFYQNTKDRYVVPILWILTLLLFLGIKHIAEREPKIFAGGRSKAFFAVFAGCLFVYGAITLVQKGDVCMLLFSLFCLLALFAFLRQHTGAGIARSAFISMCLGVVCLFNIAYGRAAVEHFTLRRMEFKAAGSWLAANLDAEDYVLMTDGSVAGYYAGEAANRILLTSSIMASDVPAFLDELSARGVRYILIDDFYIPRLKIGDPNAISRRAQLLQSLKEAAPSIKDLRLVQTFPAYTGGQALLYEYNFKAK